MLAKKSLFPLVSKFIENNHLLQRHYAEPYAGGCGLALRLLYRGLVSDIHINDLDRGIWAFWDSVLHNTKDLTDKIRSTPVTIEEWHRQKENYRKKLDNLTHGFATFFLNRTNRSGIIEKAGVLGGLTQTGIYKLDCRFNKDGLIRRIKRVADYKNRIHLTNLDACEFMEKSENFLPDKTFFFIDPPYFSKGSSLYTNFYQKGDHALIAQTILALKHPWLLTYDNEEDIKKLYRSHRQFAFNLNYSANIKRIGTEILIASDGLSIPNILTDNQSYCSHAA